MSMHSPQRGSMFFTTSSTLCGVGKCLSSGPWLWNASLMSYSLTKRSVSRKVSLSGGAAYEAVMVSSPAARPHSNCCRISPTLFFR